MLGVKGKLVAPSAKGSISVTLALVVFLVGLFVWPYLFGNLGTAFRRSPAASPPSPGAEDAHALASASQALELESQLAASTVQALELESQLAASTARARDLESRLAASEDALREAVDKAAAAEAALAHRRAADEQQHRAREAPDPAAPGGSGGGNGEEKFVQRLPASPALLPRSECVVPVIGIPVSPAMIDYTTRFLASIDSTVGTLVLVINGNDPATLEWAEGVQPGGHIESVIKVWAPGNLGVAGATNRIMLETPGAPFWMVTNNDIKLAPGALEVVCRAGHDPLTHTGEPRAGSLHPSMLSGIFPHRDFGWSVFVLLRRVVETLGLWDENLYPAYAEDGDFETRMRSADLYMMRLDSAKVYHGPEKEKEYTSGTERGQQEARHPFFSHVLRQVERSDREGYMALKYEGWMGLGKTYNGDAVIHKKWNPDMFGWWPIYGPCSKTFANDWGFDPLRRLCILNGSAPAPCSFDSALAMAGEEELHPADSQLRRDLLFSWNGVDKCIGFVNCHEKFKAVKSPLRKDTLLPLERAVALF
jgi:hypothetical protein